MDSIALYILIVWLALGLILLIAGAITWASLSKRDPDWWREHIIDTDPNDR